MVKLELPNKTYQLRNDEDVDVDVDVNPNSNTND